MKRSEMVKAMARVYLGLLENENHTAMDIDDDTMSSVEETMSGVLAFMEFKGMKPPVEDTCPVLFTTKHTWESENEVP